MKRTDKLATRCAEIAIAFMSVIVDIPKNVFMPFPACPAFIRCTQFHRNLLYVLRYCYVTIVQRRDEVVNQSWGETFVSALEIVHMWEVGKL